MRVAAAFFAIRRALACVCSFCVWTQCCDARSARLRAVYDEAGPGVAERSFRASVSASAFRASVIGVTVADALPSASVRVWIIDDTSALEWH